MENFSIEIRAIQIALRTEGFGPDLLVACGDPTSSFASALENLSWGSKENRDIDVWVAPSKSEGWGPHPTLPNFNYGSKPGTHPSVILEFNQSHVGFLFTTTGSPDDLWWVWMANGESPCVAISFIGRNGFGRATTTPTPVADAAGEPTATLEPAPGAPYLTALATDAASLEHWQGQRLPFRIRRTES